MATLPVGHPEHIVVSSGQPATKKRKPSKTFIEKSKTVPTRDDKRAVHKAKTDVQTESLQLSSSLSPLDLATQLSLSPIKVVETNPGEGSSASPISRSEPTLLDAELIGQVCCAFLGCAEP
jgi:hypothetical protein